MQHNSDKHFFRVVEKDWMALDVNGEVFGSACFASGWYDTILGKVKKILNYNNYGHN